MKTLWAFEPRSQSVTSIKGMARLLMQFAPGPRDLEVGYVVTESEMYLYTAYDVPESERFTAFPKKLIELDLKKAAVKMDPSKIHIFNYRTMSTTPAVDHLLKQTRKRGARLLALYTQNKVGIERLVLGSFAETAVHRSRIDLLLAGPKTKFAKRTRNIFFASDFSPKAKKDLGKVIDLCQHFGAGLTVFHAANVRYQWAIDETDPKLKAYRRATDQMAEWIANQCSRAGVANSVVINADFNSIPNQALKSARKTKADLIVVRAKIGPGAALMGGSVTRNILRNSRVPVLILKS